jgi:hypothetical protein
MQLNAALLATVLLACASSVMSAEIFFFEGAGCTGTVIGGTGISVGTNVCAFLIDNGSGKSIGYSGVPNQIQFYLSGGGHNDCTNSSFLTDPGGSGCATAPDG